VVTSNDMRSDEQVAVISGAGGGLGKEYAVLLASRGARIVVNDIGGSVTGDGLNCERGVGGGYPPHDHSRENRRSSAAIKRSNSRFLASSSRTSNRLRAMARSPTTCWPSTHSRNRARLRTRSSATCSRSSVRKPRKYAPCEALAARVARSHCTPTVTDVT
jgi:NAD(P)-dependent dehydrogenase (short-subunit alcohol dehydrogenase family)